MFEQANQMFNSKSVPSNISYKFFTTWKLHMENSYSDHRNFVSINQA